MTMVSSLACTAGMDGVRFVDNVLSSGFSRVCSKLRCLDI